MVFFAPKSAESLKKGISKEYLEFLLQEQRMREPKSFYEKFCKFAESLRIKPSKSMEEKLKFNIVFSSLNVSPTGVLSATLLIFILSFLSILPLIPFLNDVSTSIFLLLIPVGLAWYFYTYPSFKASVLRVQAGDEAIKIILYMAIYLKLNPSLEGAVNFAVERAKGPISEDMRKAMWDLQTGKYKTVEEALGQYTQKWVWWNEDFVRALSLIYGVLIEPTEKGREEILRKALAFVLDATHQRMKVYVEEIYSPIMMLHVFGLLLPVMGLVMFPMVAIFLHQQVSTPQLILGYIIFLPLLLYFLINRILQKRPGALMVPDISKHPELPPKGYFGLKVGGKKFYVPIFIFSVLIGFLIMTYGILHFINLFFNLMFPTQELLVELECPTRITPQKCVLMKEASLSVENLLSTFSITAGFASIFISYFYLKSFQRIKIRNEIKNIEEEFRIGLFTMGNYLSEGYPIETGIQKTLEEYEKLGMQKKPSYSFFRRIFGNMKNLGMTFKRAIFDKDYGVLRFYPSVLIEEITRILSDASEKSAVLLGAIAKTIANYLENINLIEMKIKELLEETRSAIKLQASFVIPVVTGIVSSLAVFILEMLRILAEKLSQIERLIGIFPMQAGAKSFIDLLVGGFENVVPMTVLQASIGIYTVEAVALFSLLLSGIENGFDETARDWEIAQNLIRAVIVYGLISLISLFAFWGISTSISRA